MSTEVLVVDDDEDILRLLSLWLTDAGYSTLEARDGVQGLQQFLTQRPDLVVIDVMMPRMDGLELCRHIRQVSNVPIIFLSAKTQEADKVKGLGFGGDDYVTKPVPRREFIARIQAALRRAGLPSADADTSIYTDGYLTIDFERYEVFVQQEEVHLTPLEFQLLKALVKNARRVLSHEDLQTAAWGPASAGTESVKWHMTRLRRKIGDTSKTPHMIKTARGTGYRYDPPEMLPSPGSPSRQE